MKIQIVTELSEAISVTEEVAETTSLISATINEPCGRRELQKNNRQDLCHEKAQKLIPLRRVEVKIPLSTGPKRDNPQLISKCHLFRYNASTPNIPGFFSNDYY